MVFKLHQRICSTPIHPSKGFSSPLPAIYLSSMSSFTVFHQWISSFWVIPSSSRFAMGLTSLVGSSSSNRVRLHQQNVNCSVFTRGSSSSIKNTSPSNGWLLTKLQTSTTLGKLLTDTYRPWGVTFRHFALPANQFPFVK